MFTFLLAAAAFSGPGVALLSQQAPQAPVLDFRHNVIVSGDAAYVLGEPAVIDHGAVQASATHGFIWSSDGHYLLIARVDRSEPTPAERTIQPIHARAIDIWDAQNHRLMSFAEVGSQQGRIEDWCWLAGTDVALV